MKFIRILLSVLHAFVDIGAIFLGQVAIVNPEAPIGASVDAFKNLPFRNYLIPGIILFTVIVLGNIFSSLSIIFKSRFQGYISGVFSFALIIWIVVQVIMLNGVHFLHVLFFCIGVIEYALSMAIMFEQRLYPTDIIYRLYSERKSGF